MHPTYTRTNPFLATLRERYALNKPGSAKNTQHMVLDIRGSDIQYKTGDSIGIYALNDPDVVSTLLQRLEVTGDEEVHTRNGEALSLHEFLSTKANLATCNRKLATLVWAGETDTANKRHLEELLKEENKDQLKEYLAQRQVWDFLGEHPYANVPYAHLCTIVMPLLPRFYSIASSMQAVGEEAHLTVALTEYITNGHKRYGVASHYLCNLAPMHEAVVPIYLQPSKDFTLPEDLHAPVIMIGPGTGVAPFRGFMQERLALGSHGKSWLFFGEWNRAYDFLYDSYWKELEARGKLRLDLAFSRDQQHKIYVQHKMLEHGRDIYHWLQDGAYIYVCGDAERMAKEVEQALITLVAQHGGMTEEDAQAYVKKLRQDKRYLRDVY